MPAQPDLHLTEERIRTLVKGTPDYLRKVRGIKNPASAMWVTPEMRAEAAASGRTLLGALSPQFDELLGPGAGQHTSDAVRLVELLSHLEQGTIEEAIAREEAGDEAQAATYETYDIQPWMAAQRGAARARRIADLRDIQRSEVDAVFACLDEIETIHPAEVSRIRFRHDPGVRERRLAAAAAVRTGDPSRPPLGEERMRRVVEVLLQLAPVPQKMQDSLALPYERHGKPALELLGASVVRKVAKLGEDPEAYARDLWWTKVIADHLHDDGTIDEKLARLQEDMEPKVLRSPYVNPARAKRRAAEGDAVTTFWYDIVRRIGRDEEETVRRLLPEIRQALRAAHGR
jgi:hypothetical protein